MIWSQTLVFITCPRNPIVKLSREQIQLNFSLMLLNTASNHVSHAMAITANYLITNYGAPQTAQHSNCMMSILVPLANVKSRVLQLDQLHKKYTGHIAVHVVHFWKKGLQEEALWAVAFKISYY